MSQAKKHEQNRSRAKFFATLYAFHLPIQNRLRTGLSAATRHRNRLLPLILLWFSFVALGVVGAAVVLEMRRGDDWIHRISGDLLPKVPESVPEVNVIVNLTQLQNPDTPKEIAPAAIGSIDVNFGDSAVSCLTGLYAADVGEDQFLLETSDSAGNFMENGTLLYEFQNLCGPGSANVTLVGSPAAKCTHIGPAGVPRCTVQKRGDLDVSLVAPHPNPSSYYPFDTRKLDFVLWATVKYSEGPVERVSPNVASFVNLPDWTVAESAISDATIASEHNSKVTRLQISFERPFSVQLLAIVLLAAMAVFILLLLVTNDTGSALQVATAILLGLWGLRAILHPPHLVAVTRIDWTLRLLYLLLAWVVVVRFGILPLWRRTTGETVTERSESLSTDTEAPTPIPLSPTADARSLKSQAPIDEPRPDSQAGST